jgi:hypothetical protein
MTDTQIEKANGKCTLKLNNNCNCKVESFEQKDNKVSPFYKNINKYIWFILLTVVIYLILRNFI